MYNLVPNEVRNLTNTINYTEWNTVNITVYWEVLYNSTNCNNVFSDSLLSVLIIQTYPIIISIIISPLMISDITLQH